VFVQTRCLAGKRRRLRWMSGCVANHTGHIENAQVDVTDIRKLIPTVRDEVSPAGQ